MTVSAGLKALVNMEVVVGVMSLSLDGIFIEMPRRSHKAYVIRLMACNRC